MKLFDAKTLVALAGLVSQGNGAEIDVETCLDLETAVEATLTEDTTATITTTAPFDGEDCGNGTFKTLEVKTNQLTIVPSDDDSAQFWDIRFVVTDGGKLIITPDAEFEFNSDDENDLEVNGGFLHVDEDSTARFLGDLAVYDFAVRSVPDESSDFSNDVWDGGCVWNNGSFRVDGYAIFSSCDNIGGGENSPGRGGAIFNAINGFILFEGGVLIEETSITDDEGNSGAGIYNFGKVNITGDSIFQDLTADSDGEAGGGVYNAEGATFTFSNNAAVMFSDASAGVGGGVYNLGEFTFSGPALFAQSSGTAIYNAGTMKLSEDSAFFFNDGWSTYNVGAVTNRAGATLDIPDAITFVSNTGTLCNDIYLEGTDTDTEDYTCYP